MRRHLLAGAACLALAVPFAAPAGAQEWFLEAEAGGLAFAARDSFEAVFGESAAPIFGVGGGYQWDSGPFVRAGLRHVFSRDGQRVFVSEPGAPVFGLGHPLQADATPVFGTLGYRFGSGTLKPYLGAGAGVTRYREESTVAGVVDSIDESRFSWRVVGGVQILKGSFRLALEATWASAPDLLGRGGVSAVYGETDGGGVSGVAKLVFVP